MGLSFLAPLFLAGLAAVAIPIIVHLTNRPRSDAYAFPSLMFLARIPFRTVRRQRIRHWWLLAIRTAVIVLVVAAFARPLLERLGDGGGAFGGGREVVVLLDDSYSMGYGDRWERALAAARRVVNGLGPADRATIVRFADRARASQQSTADHVALLAALAGARPGYGATRYAPALQLARDLLEQSDRPRRAVVLISDFQSAAWRAEDGIRLPPGTALERVNLSDPGAANLAVTGLLAERGYRGPREEVTLSARVANLGAESVGRLPVTLEVDGRAMQTATTSLQPRATGVVTFSPLPVVDRPLLVTVQAGNDALPTDNRYYAVVTPTEALRVLLTLGQGRGDESLFLRQALGVSVEPRFQLDVKDAIGDLRAHAVVVLNGGVASSSAVAGHLAEFVRGGGGLLVVLGGRSAGGGTTEWRTLLGGLPGGAVEPAGPGGAGLAGLAFDHPVFQPFRTPRSGDFGSVRVYRYRRFEPAEGSVVLARYDDGAPALVEHGLGSGRVLVWTSALDNVWSDLPVQPVFLPLVHQMARYLGRYVERRWGLVVGQLLDVETARQAARSESDLILERPSGARDSLTAGAGPPVSLDEPGFYPVRTLDAGAAAGVLAVNLDPREADLSPLDADAFAAAVTTGGAAAAAAGSAAPARLGPTDRERRQGLWWYLVAGAVVLALAETLLSNRLPAIGRAGSAG